jgi:predicted metal-dependent phosphoesterase TrpH
MGGLRKADLHVHSRWSYDVPDLPAFSPRALFELSLEHEDPGRRMDLFALTDHDTMAGYEELVRELPEADRDLVIPAVEHTIRDPEVGFTTHVGLFGIDPDRYAELRQRVETIDELLHFCREHGIYSAYNHPIWWERDEYRSGCVDLSRIPQLASRFEVLEINGGRPVLMNLIAAGLARHEGKAVIATSDTHSGEVGIAFTESSGATAGEFLSNVWAGNASISVSCMSSESLLRAAHVIIDALLDAQVREIDSRVTHHDSRWVHQLAARVLSSDAIHNRRTLRLAARGLLRETSRRLVQQWMRYERQLDETLQDSELGRYTLLHFDQVKRGDATAPGKVA